MLKADAKFQVERRLTLDELLEALAADGRINSAERRRLGSLSPGSIHPLVFLAEQKLPDATRDGAPLDMTALLAWLGERCGQSVVEIDPLKVNVAAVAEVMSRAFAERHRILAVEVDDDEVVIASAEPYQRSWQENLEHVVRRRIRRVLADPRDIMRFTAEFYTMAGSVRGARAAGAGAGRPIGNLEQMLELGSNREPDANDQHIVSIVDWLLQYAFEQRASDIHIEPRREIGVVRFRIDGVLNTVYELPDQVCAAVTSRIKILGRMDVAEKRRPQDGRLKTRSPGGAEVELRLSTLPTAFGEKLVMRIFDPGADEQELRGPGPGRRRPRALAPHDRHGQRHRAGHGAHGLRQDHDPVLDAAPAGDAGSERVHDRGPDRDGGGPSTRCR
jgi:general secretion pathway protein E